MRPSPSATEAETSTLKPNVGARIEFLDVLRGFALLGVLLVNTLYFAGPIASSDPWATSAAGLDRASELAVRVLAEGAFYSIFALLFGIGISLQANRPRRFALARMLVLLALGLAHHLFLWDGDILLPYGIAGIAALPLVSRPSRSLLAFAAALASGFLLALGALTWLSYSLGRHATTDAEINSEVASRLSASYADRLLARLDHLPASIAWALFSATWFLAFFLVGMWLARTHLPRWAVNRTLLTSIIKRSLLVAVPAKVFLAAVVIVGDGPWASTIGALLSAYIGGPALGAIYASLIAALLLGRRGLAKRCLHPLRAVGRMSLTNYLTQSVVAVVVYEGSGLGLYGSLATTWALALAFLVFAAQILISNWWLSVHSSGPAELVWRRLARFLAGHCHRPRVA